MNALKQMFAALGLALALLLAGGIAKAAQPEKSDLAWSYDTLVEPLPRAPWLEKVVVLCMPYETPYEADGQKLKPWAERLQGAGFTLAGMYPDATCRLYESTPQENWADACRKEVSICHRLGIKVIAGAYPFVGSRGPRDLIAAHPEWRLVGETAPSDPTGIGCMVNPEYAAALRELLARRVKEFDIDAYQFDGWYQQTYCRCEGCKTLYKNETGLSVPPKMDQADPAYRRYLTWRDQHLLENLLALRKAVKAVKPDFALIIWNNNDTAGAAPSWMPEALNCVADWTNKETWWANDVNAVWLNKRLRGASGDDCPPGIQPYMFMRWDKDINSGVFHGSSLPMTELLYRMHELMTFGGVPIIWSAARAGWQPEDWETVAQAYIDFLPYVHQTRTIKYAVCIDSYSTLQSANIRATNRAFHEGEGNELDQAVGSHRAGITRALLEAHVPFDVVSEHNVSDKLLNQYKVVILPNNFAMSGRIAATLRRFVKQGGGLVATHETSLYDEYGKKGENFALGDLFAADYEESRPATANRVSFTTHTHEVTEDKAMRALMGERGMTTYWGKYVRVKPTAKAVTPLAGFEATEKLADSARNWTPLVLSQPEKGRVAYFPAAIDSAYFEAGYPYQRMLLVNAVRWAAGAPAPVTIEAPMSVFAGFLTKDASGRKQRLVHLLNGFNSTTGHGSKEEKQFAIREEIVPVHDIRVSIKGERPRRAFLIPGNTELPVSDQDGSYSVSVDRVDQHAVVVFEY